MGSLLAFFPQVHLISSIKITCSVLYFYIQAGIDTKYWFYRLTNVSEASLWGNGLTLNTCSLQYSPCQDLNQSICTWYMKDTRQLHKSKDKLRHWTYPWYKQTGRWLKQSSLLGKFHKSPKKKLQTDLKTIKKTKQPHNILEETTTFFLTAQNQTAK